MNFKNHVVPELIVKKFRNIILKEEEEFLNNWLNASPRHLKIFSEITDEKSLVKSLQKYYDYNVELAWEKVLDKINVSSIRSGQLLRTWLKYAAIFIPLLVASSVLVKLIIDRQNTMSVFASDEIRFAPGTQTAHLTLSNGEKVKLGGQSYMAKKVRLSESNFATDTSNTLIYDNLKTSQAEVSYNTLETPKGGEYKLVLPDGTMVWLNAASQIVYPEVFNDSIRQVKIFGEAYFEVAHEADRPFIVTSGLYDVKVLGTEFNIMAYADDDVSATTLVQGKVKISTHFQGNSILLDPGQQAQLNIETQDINVEQVEVNQFIAWKEGMFVFQSTSLESIMKTLSRWYDCEFQFDTQQIKTSLFTGSLNKYQTLDEILLVISQSCDLEFMIVDTKTVRIKS